MKRPRRARGTRVAGKISSDSKQFLAMDCAYEGGKTRQKAVNKGFVPVVPPKQNRKEPWTYDKQLCKRRNEIERFFLRIKRFRKVFTRYDKLDTSYIAVVNFAMVFDALV
jgi:transposase